MKSIKKITNKVTDNFSALAGSALLVGATLTGGAALASAQSGSSGDSMAMSDMDLGEYPQPFVTEDGEVQTSIVLGSDAAVTDVVGATEIAGSLGNAAFGEESVSTGGSGAGASWTASNGVTLDTSNDNLYFGNDISEVRETLTDNDLDILAETTFTDDNNEETDVTNYLNVGDLAVQFNNDADELDGEDPEVHVEVPSEGSVDSASDEHLFNLQANFEDSIAFDTTEVAGEEIELFGTEYTIADENTDNSDELLLYGSQQDVDVNSGESTTITVNEEEVTLEVVSVNTGSTSSGESGNAAVRVDGTLESVESGDTIAVNNEEVRIDEIIKTGGSDSSQGVVNFKIGSSELTLQDGEPIQDSDGDDIEGSRVYFNGDESTDTEISSISSIDLYVGAEDDDQDAITADETFTHSALPGVEFQFGGLSPNAQDSENSGEVTVQTNGDEDATVDFQADGESQSLNFLHTESNIGSTELGDSDGDDLYVLTEGNEVREDDYVVTDAGDFSHLWEATSINEDFEGDGTGEATVDLNDVVTGDSRELTLEEVGSGSALDGIAEAADREIIDGQTYYVWIPQGTDNIKMTWGTGAGYGDTGAATTFAPGLDLDSGAALSMLQTTNDVISADGSNSQSAGFDTDTDELRLSGGTGVTDVESVEVTYTSGGSQQTMTIFDGGPNDADGSDDGVIDFSRNELGESGSVTVDSLAVEADSAGTVTVAQNAGTVSGTINDVTVSTNPSDIEFASTESTDAQFGTDVELANSGTTSDTSTVAGVSYSVDEDGTVTVNDLGSAGAGVAVIEPENDNDNENAHVLTPNSYSSDDGYSFSGTGAISYTQGLSFSTLEGSDDDLQADYTVYGSYVEQDTDEEGSTSVMVPQGQSTAGAAFTGVDGSLSASAGAGSVNAAQPTYQYADGVLADDGNVGQVKNNDNIIVVGGPAANSLTQELVEENQTMPAGDYTQGQGMIQMVDGWSEGNSALVVAGATGEDTRTAAEFLADYRNNQDALEGNSQVTIETSSGSVVN